MRVLRGWVGTRMCVRVAPSRGCVILAVAMSVGGGGEGNRSLCVALLASLLSRSSQAPDLALAERLTPVSVDNGASFRVYFDDLGACSVGHCARLHSLLAHVRECP